MITHPSRFGIIGAGMIARIHARAIQSMPDATLHAVYNRSPDSAAILATEFSAITHTCIDAFLADTAIDIVTVCTPSGAHLDPTLAALRAGKHVLVEKPIEITTARIDQLVATAGANNVTVSSILNRRFNPAMNALKHACDCGRFGRVTLAEASVRWWRTQEYYDANAWRGTWALDGGGVLMNQAIHTIDQLLYLCGDVDWVQADAACLAHERIEVEDTATAILRFRNGALGVIKGSTACWSSTGHPAEVQISGTRGSAILADESLRVWDFLDPAPEDAEIRATLMARSAIGLGANDPRTINITGHVRNFTAALAAIRAGHAPSTSGTEARRAVAVIEAIYTSARDDGRRVTPA